MNRKMTSVRSIHKICRSVRLNQRSHGSFRKPCRSRLGPQTAHLQAFARNPQTCFEGPFGEAIRATGPMAKANPFRFSTK
jgi:hypothetical protein